MKKVILMLSMLAVVVLCYSCASNWIASGRAQSVATTTSFTITLGDRDGYSHREYTKDNPVTYSECVGYCNDKCRRGGLQPARKVDVFRYNECYCIDVPYDLSRENLTYLGNTSSDDECSRLALTSGYLRYCYIDGKCSGKIRYESVGTAMTKKECQEIVKQTAPQAGAIYVAKTQQCYYAYKEALLGF